MDNARALLAAMPGQVAVVGLDGRLLAVNPNWQAFAAANGLVAGRGAAFQDLTVCAAADGPHAPHARAAAEGIRAVLEGARTEFTLDYPCHAAGEQRWLRMTVTPLFWDGARAALVAHANVTHEALAQQAAETGRQQLASALMGLAEQSEVLDKAHDGIVVRSVEGVVRYWNQGAARIYGWSADEAQGVRFQDLVPDQQPSVEELLPQLLEQGQLSVERRVRRKDGQVIWVNSACTVLKDRKGQPERILSISTDITQLKTYAEELLRSQRLLETAQGAARLGSVELDHGSGAVLRCSGVQSLLQLDFRPLNLDQLLTWMAPAARQALRAAIADTVGQPSFELELEMLQPDGPRWLRARRAALPDPCGPGISTIVFQDITAMRAARDEVMRLNRALERRVARRTRELEAVNQELEAFAYSVSHDLKAPLAAIDGFTQLLADRLQGRLDEREATFLQRVRSAVAGMFALIDAMQGLHQLARQPLQREEVDLSALARGIVQELREQEPERQAIVRIEPGIRAVCDAALMEIALRNLIGNAWKFSGGKPVTEISLHAEPCGPEGGVTLVLQDHGAGFEPEFTDRLFTPFQRLHHADEFPGTGVGLATVQRILARHGGTARAEGRVGEGAIFRITLPHDGAWSRSDNMSE